MTDDTINDDGTDEEQFAYGGFHVEGTQCPMNAAKGIDGSTKTNAAEGLAFEAYDRAVDESIDELHRRGCVPESIAREAWLDGIESLREQQPTTAGDVSRRYDDAIEIATDVAETLGWIEQADLDDGDGAHPTIAGRMED